MFSFVVLCRELFRYPSPLCFRSPSLCTISPSPRSSFSPLNCLLVCWVSAWLGSITLSLPAVRLTSLDCKFCFVNVQARIFFELHSFWELGRSWFVYSVLVLYRHWFIYYLYYYYYYYYYYYCYYIYLVFILAFLYFVLPPALPNLIYAGPLGARASYLCLYPHRGFQGGGLKLILL
jgi:hypothetical protein